ncbi:hypothetical protein [Oligella sp. MSHR50489EDL]|uniref:hypothetical protein n=1 Tax=Oligella sp. MSHR50489EDL TaxID=3139409 RepID=UPI003D81B168
MSIRTEFEYKIPTHQGGEIGIKFPPVIQAYMDLMSAASKVPTYVQMGEAKSI